ncbi:uncharacterized protein [Embiotoca jacksoni]|uniref:uncharacterized protein n=1 Tax=Embiotoca jacksoni TaxID=100190 RepID=UPI00370375C2
MHTAQQAGQRSLPLPGSGMMVSTTFIKDTGILRLLILGLLLPSVLVSGLNSSTTAPLPNSSNTSASTSNTTDRTNTSTAIPATKTTMQTPTAFSTQEASNTQPLNTISVSIASTAQTSTSGATTTSAFTQPSMMTTDSATTTSITQSTISTPSGVGSATKSKSSTTMTASSSSSSMSSGSGSLTSMMYTSQSSNSIGTTMPNPTSMSMIYCPSFTCNYSECYSMYTSQNTTLCTAGDSCQLFRQTDMCYNASCSTYCTDKCLNTTQTNCSVKCCNSTGCLNDTFASMMMMTTVNATTTTTTPVPTTTASQPTTADNGYKCHYGMCIGNDCYTSFKNAALQTCLPSQPHCQLKKETQDSTFKWTSGCTNCTGYTACKATTNPPCHLECCNATMTSSCLWLNGTMNVPSFATRGPCFHTELIASLLCLLAITLLL